MRELECGTQANLQRGAGIFEIYRGTQGVARRYWRLESFKPRGSGALLGGSCGVRGFSHQRRTLECTLWKFVHL